MSKIEYAVDTMGFGCPVCNKQLEVPVRAVHNVTSYQDPVNVRAECCGQIIRLSCRLQLVADRADPSLTEDGWGVEAEDLS